MTSLIECVANFSEGRDRARIEALVSAMSSVPGAAVLDCHSDPDHNRSVVTLAGRPEAVAEAALRGVGKAAELIDLTRHRGVHPRIGAADVLPFVPLEGWSLEDCANLAHHVGGEIWERFGIPVYFYGAAARRPDRAALENVRRGQFEGLRDAALLFPERAPDIGGPGLHPTAGAVAVGARKFLIACNVDLQCTPSPAPTRAGTSPADEAQTAVAGEPAKRSAADTLAQMSVAEERAPRSVAEKIARAIRASGNPQKGVGLPGVKAIGVALESRGLAQVSINLTDFAQTSLARLFDAVRREAGRYGCTVVEEEIVGLVPRKALEASGGAKPPAVLRSQILENRLAEMLPQLFPGATPSNEPLLESILMNGFTP